MDMFQTAHSLPFNRRRLVRLVVLALVLAAGAMSPLTVRAAVDVDVGVSVGFPPPPLPLYVQPAIPGPDYLWVPGYWAWDGADYYWVPGYWVLPPYIGALWTPPYWGWFGDVYVFHPGYWGRHVGFYGGIDYGFGYPGHGYVGGHWEHGNFYYNRSVNQINDPRITHVYNGVGAGSRFANRTSFNGGRGGVIARPTMEEAVAGREAHVAPVAAQQHQAEMANRDPAMRVGVNHGAPLVAGAARPAAAGVSAATHPSGQARPSARNVTALRSAGFAPHAAMTPPASRAMETPGGRAMAPATNRAMEPPANRPMHAAAPRTEGFAPPAARAWNPGRMSPNYAYRPAGSPGMAHAPAAHPAPARAPSGGHNADPRAHH
ncbi:hypothetical protein DVT68_02950 [Dyella solisilvae]|uniref:BcpO-related WXXGXW repeat protein n=1 Tax=Dyella solisilvae TaxID=1920168 RepID=A0A370KB42_9GAMM|nr:YXWGXW repeat-containing protein [Dyella solisilvae]RDI99809.1 hypothetical protein DVT68_02950 [Dyella solisilvae]